MYLQSIPSYVYKITIVKTGEFYFGFRKANKVLPTEDFLIKYFSSSKYLKTIIKEQGLDAVLGEIVYTDIDSNAAYWKEQQLIQEEFDNPMILNKQYQKTNMGFKMFLTTPESVAKMLDTRKKRGCQSKPDYIRTQQAKHNKKYLVTSPEGETYEIFGLKAHCDKFNLNHPAMSQVGLGNKPHHKGWKCVRLSD